MNARTTGQSPAGEEALVALACQNDEEAFVRLASRYTALLQTLANKYTKSVSETDDLVQEGMLGLLSAVQRYRPAKGVPFRSFALVCIRNRMLSALRQRRGVEAVSIDDEDKPAPLTGGEDPESVVLQQEKQEQLQELLRSTLSALEYNVLMAFLNGYSYREIARYLSVDDKAVDNALQRLRRKLLPLCEQWL